MRLTLRTMLAYLDGILSPEDSQDIGKKIEDSTFASDLIHRIRYLLHRPSMTEPSKNSMEFSLGPNTVAEYLDNTLPPDKVTEFEKICLESELHLAEVASCHQILTLVLGEPAEIDPVSRQRIYDIQAQYALSAGQTSGNETDTSADSETEIVMPPPLPAYSTLSIEVGSDHKKRSKPTVPDYLREPNNKYRWISITVAGMAALILLIMFLSSMGQFKAGSTIGNMLARMGIIGEKTEIAAETKQTTPSTTTQLPSPAPATSESQLSSNVAKEPSTTETIEKKPGTSAESETLKIEATPPSETAPAAARESTEQPKSSVKIPSGNEVVPTVTGGQDHAKEEAEQPPKESTSEPPKESDKTAADIAPAMTTMVTSDEKPVEEKPLPPSERLGRFMSENQILLKTAGETADWRRVVNKEFLSADQKLLALPTYRPELTLGTEATLRMLGGTELQLLPSVDREPAGIKIRYGRIVAMPLANAPIQLRIMIGQRTGILTFVDPEAIVAIDVRRIHTPGIDPETGPSRIECDFFASAGHVLWDETGEKTLEITAPSRFVMVDKSPPEATTSKDFPKWITTDVIGMLDRRASSTITQVMTALPETRPAQRGLMELAEHRQKEVRRLAIRCLSYLDYFDPLVTVLDEPESKQDWSDNVEQLREAVSRDAETAADIRKSLENRYPQNAAEMYRMLWGYSDKDLAAGEDRQLVKYLDSDILAIRVLSFWNLNEITGLGLFYRPEQTAAKRIQPVQRWKQRLEANEIRIKSAEEKAGNAAKESESDTPER